MAGNIGHVAVFSEKRNKSDEGHDGSFGILCIEIAFVHRVFQSGFAHREGQQGAFFLTEPFICDTVKGRLDVRVTLQERFVFGNGHTGLFGMVDVHAHLGTFFAADLIIRQGETRFLAAFDIAEALASVFFQKVLCHA